MPLRTARVTRTVAAFFLAGSAMLALGSACGDTVSDGSAEVDGGSSTGIVEPAVCPKVAPGRDEPCRLPEGTTCAFGESSCVLVECTRGSWRYGTTGAADPPCPETVPNAGVACPPCWPSTLACTYGSTDCSREDASLNTAVATCPSGRWAVDIRACRDGGGSNVQGDAASDGD